MNNDLEISEKSLGFYKILDIKSNTNVTVTIDILLRYQLNLDMYRGQYHDDASNMLEISFGVANQIFAEKPKVHYRHCHAHSISFSV